MDQGSEGLPLSQALQSSGATAWPRRCHLVTSPGWSVAMNQHFPSPEQRRASPKYMKEEGARLQAEEGKQSSRVLFVVEPITPAKQKVLEPRHSAHPLASDWEHPIVLSIHPALPQAPSSITIPDPRPWLLL